MIQNTKLNINLYELICKKKRIILFILIIFSFVITIIENPYKDIDSYWISIITNGLFGQDNYCVHMSPLLCKILKYIKEIFPQSDVYLLVVRTIYYLTIISICANLERKESAFNILSISLILFLIAGIRIPVQNYTVQASYFVSIGWYIFASNIMSEKKSRCSLLFSVLYILFGACIRIESALLVVPFGVLALVLMLVLYKPNIKRCAQLLIPCVLIIAVIFSNTVYDLVFDYDQGHSFNNNRIKIVDYPMKKWDEIESVSDETVSENDYSSAINHFLIDYKRIDAEYLYNIYEIGKNDESKFLSQENLKNALQILISQLCLDDLRTTVMFLIAIGSLLLVLLSDKVIWSKVGALLSIIGTLLILSYFALKGRLISRVCVSVLVPAILFLFSLACNSIRKRNKLMVVFAVGIMLVSTLNVLVLLKNNTVLPKWSYNAASSEINDETSQIDSDYSHKIYLWDTHLYNSIALDMYKKKGKLPTRKFLDTNISEGDWPYGQRYMHEYYSRIGYNDSLLSFLLDNNVLYISYNKDEIETYLREHYNSTTELTRAGYYDDIPVWKISVD